jgi:hypothetical protein
MKYAHILMFGVIYLSGCTAPVTNQDAGHSAVTVWDDDGHEDVVSQPLWKSQQNRSHEDAVSVEDGFLQPVAIGRIFEAAKPLEQGSCVPISFSTAKRLIGGGSYASPSSVTRLTIRAKKARIEELEDLSRTFPDRASEFAEESAEVNREIVRLRSVLPKLSPYLCRAVAFRNCGTGGFSAVATKNGLWIYYSALGHGDFSKYNQPVIVFLPSRPDRSGFSWSVAE